MLYTYSIVDVILYLPVILITKCNDVMLDYLK